MTHTLRYIFIGLIAVAASVNAVAAGLQFTGASKRAIEVTPEASTGLNALYVLEDAAVATAVYRADSPSATVRWYRFGESGGAYAEEVAVDRSGAETSLALTADDCGFIIEEGTRRYYYWVTNYANHRLTLQGVSVDAADSDCGSAALNVRGDAAPIIYYTINGLPKTLDREINVTYNTLEYDESAKNYKQVEVSKQFANLTALIHVNQPLCSTRFALSGDRFLKAWGVGQTVATSFYEAVAVDARTWAEQTQREVDNESSSSLAGLGGSAPVEITFTAVATDAAKFAEWQFSRDPEFNVIDLRFNQSEVTYTFTEFGTTYVRFQASNDDGSCDYYSESYQVEVGESKLLCPNAFSPANEDGVNDEWKVSYKSIVEFECHIFNRWGVKMATLTHPSQGWDGRYGGKFVPSGVYYYVIKAVGADGRKYDLSGDINIINYSRTSGSASDSQN